MIRTFFRGSKSDSGFILASSVVILLLWTLLLMCLSTYVQIKYRAALREYKAVETAVEAPYDAS